MTEPEYLKRQEVRRTEQPTLDSLKVELPKAVQEQRDREAQTTTVPVKVRSFLEDFQSMDVPRAKDILQTILKAAHVWKAGRIEVEFR